ncbi:hypothetical protein PM082_023963 [Marasmius tenuissimus]|nr:hypothetical protein PM082_023963 [Marasmius tenuissimus]
MRASSQAKDREDRRDATYVRNLEYAMIVDIHKNCRTRAPEYELQSFYGQLQHIYVVKFTSSCPELGVTAAETIIIAAIRNCKLTEEEITGLDMRFYRDEGPMHVVDVKNLQCLVGRVRDRNEWAIIDRSGALAQAEMAEDDE